MKPAPFDYVLARSVGQALAVLGDGAEEARVLAGGQSLVPLMSQRLLRPKVLVDVTGIFGLDAVSREGDVLKVGATCRQLTIELDDELARVVPALAEAASLAGPRHVRGRATIGGSLAHADPAAELPAALLAQRASVVVAGPRGERRIAVRELVVEAGRTRLENDELLVAVEVPVAGGAIGGAFCEESLRGGDLPIVGMACSLRLDAAAACAQIGMAACGVGPGPVDLTDAASVALGEESPGRGLLRAVALRVGAAIDPPSDAAASSERRREVAQLLAVESLAKAWRRAGAG